MAGTVQEEAQRLSIEMRLLEETAEALQSRINMVDAAMTDLRFASSALEGLEENKVGSELLVPTGGNSFVKAKLDDPDKVIVGIGAGVSLEKTFEEAKDVMKKRLEGLEKTKESLQQRFGQVAQKIAEDQVRLRGLVGELRKEKPSGNV